MDDVAPGRGLVRASLAAAVTVAVAGVILDLYRGIWWYDLAAHAVSGFAFTLALVRLLYGRVLDGALEHPLLFVGSIILLGIGLGATWEWIEFAYEHLSGPGNAIRGKVDTELDLLADAAGAFGAGVWVAVARRRRIHRTAAPP